MGPRPGVLAEAPENNAQTRRAAAAAESSGGESVGRVISLGALRLRRLLSPVVEVHRQPPSLLPPPPPLSPAALWRASSATGGDSTQLS